MVREKKPQYEYCDQTGRSFESNTFPLICSCCDKKFENRKQYWEETEPLIKGNYSDGMEYSVFEYRNCIDCKSTIICELRDERDMSPKGIKRRETFRSQLEFLMKNGIEEEKAISILRGRFRS